MCGKPDVLVTEAQIARRLGMTRREAQELAGKPGFPEALGLITAEIPPHSSVPFWRWDDVKDWLRTHESEPAVQAPLVPA